MGAKVVRVMFEVKSKVGAHTIAARSCGRSSPVTLTFEPVVEINLLC